VKPFKPNYELELKVLQHKQRQYDYAKCIAKFNSLMAECDVIAKAATYEDIYDVSFPTSSWLVDAATVRTSFGGFTYVRSVLFFCCTREYS